MENSTSSFPVFVPSLSKLLLTGMMEGGEFLPDIEVSVGKCHITGDDDVGREDVPGHPGAEGDVQEAGGGCPDQGVHPLHVVSAGTEMLTCSYRGRRLVSLTHLLDQERSMIGTGKTPETAQETLRKSSSLLETDTVSGLITMFCGGPERQSQHNSYSSGPLTVDEDLLLLEIFVHKARDFALVSSGEPMVGLDHPQGPVSLVGVVVGHVVQVQLVLEQLSYHLGTFLHAGHPLVHGDGRPVEIPLDVQLVLLLVQVGEVAVQHQLGARLDHLWPGYAVNVD